MHESSSNRKWFISIFLTLAGLYIGFLGLPKENMPWYTPEAPGTNGSKSTDRQFDSPTNSNSQWGQPSNRALSDKPPRATPDDSTTNNAIAKNDKPTAREGNTTATPPSTSATQFDGRGLVNDVLSAVSTQKKASFLLRKALEGPPGQLGFPFNCLATEVIGKPKVIEQNAKEATISIRVVTKVDLDAYDTFATRLITVLDGVAKRKGEFSLVSESTKQPSKQGGGAFLQETYFNIAGINNASKLDSIHQKVLGTQWDQVSSFGKKITDREATEFGLSVNTSRNASFENTEWKYFVLDRSTLPLIASTATCLGELKITLQKENGGTLAVSRKALAGQYSVGTGNAYSLIAFDGVGPFLSSYEWQFPKNSQLVNNAYQELVNPNYARLGFLGPMFFNDDMSCYFPTLEHDFQIKLTVDELAQLSSINSEVRFEMDLPPTEEDIAAAGSDQP